MPGQFRIFRLHMRSYPTCIIFFNERANMPPRADAPIFLETEEEPPRRPESPRPVLPLRPPSSQGIFFPETLSLP